MTLSSREDKSACQASFAAMPDRASIFNLAPMRNNRKNAVAALQRCGHVTLGAA